jgi:2,3-bisphosphoglycerate-independent phosphoglycerate mutase
MSTPPRTLMLCILDGWGYREASECNAIALANTPNWDRLWQEFPHTLIHTSGAEVGLPADQMGNSEVGHLNLGAGRVVYQEYTRICRSIRTGSFFENRTLIEPIEAAVREGKAVHVMGLLSPGGVHSHEGHIHAMVRMARQYGAERVYVHAFLDGRDTPPKSAAASIEEMEKVFAEVGGRFASVVGRYYSMDRDQRWMRVKMSYEAIVDGVAPYQAESAMQALEMAYERDETDEFAQATVIVPPGQQPVQIQDGDVIMFMNYRSDRARQLTEAIIQEDFDGFERVRWPRLGSFTTLTEYNKNFDVPVAFPPERLRNVFGEYVASLGMRQLRIAETEKYAHVTFFFNGGEEKQYEFEDRILIPSPDVATYDLKPEMSAHEVTDKLVEAIQSGKYEFIICNLANGDMVGHSGILEAAMKAAEAIDESLGRIRAALEAAGGEMLLTADHGNCEQMCSADSDQPLTSHTTNLVPFIYVGQRAVEMKPSGALADVAPTMLHLMSIKQPIEMTGQPLLTLQDDADAPSAA